MPVRESIPLVDLKEQYVSLSDEIEAAVRDVLASGIYVGGPQVAGFEEEFARYSGASHCVGISCGTEALRLTLLACGVEPGSEVILPAFTFIATAEVVTQIGATPVFTDIDPESYCLQLREVERKITPKTAAILPVHLYGHPADLDPIVELADSRRIPVIQDACQAHGALYRGKKLAEMGSATCFSFYPSKSLGACGEGGAVVTGDGEIAQRIRMLRDHGQRERYDHEFEGYNARLHAIQACILRVKLRKLEEWIRLRRQAASRYNRLLEDLPVTVPREQRDCRHTSSLYVIRTGVRDLLLEALRSRGIGAAIHYPTPLHLLTPYRKLGHRQGAFPESEEAARTVLSIPLFPEIHPDAQERIAKCIRETVSPNSR